MLGIHRPPVLFPNRDIPTLTKPFCAIYPSLMTFYALRRPYFRENGDVGNSPISDGPTDGGRPS